MYHNAFNLLTTTCSSFLVPVLIQEEGNPDCATRHPVIRYRNAINRRLLAITSRLTTQFSVKWGKNPSRNSIHSTTYPRSRDFKSRLATTCWTTSSVHTGLTTKFPSKGSSTGVFNLRHKSIASMRSVFLLIAPLFTTDPCPASASPPTFASIDSQLLSRGEVRWKWQSD